MLIFSGIEVVDKDNEVPNITGAILRSRAHKCLYRALSSRAFDRRCKARYQLFCYVTRRQCGGVNFLLFFFADICI